jgi:hypothetical protein
MTGMIRSQNKISFGNILPTLYFFNEKDFDNWLYKNVAKPRD